MSKVAPEPSRDPVYATLWNCPTIPMFVVDVDDDSDFRYTDFNPACEKITGFTNARLMGRKIVAATEIVPAFVVDAMRANYQRCVDLRTSIQYEERIDVAAQERHWRTQLVPYIGPSGRVEKLVGIAIDITDRVREEAARMETDAKFSALVEAASEGVCLFDQQWRTQYTNPALTHMLGYSADELRELHVEQVIFEQDAPRIADEKKNCEAGKANTGELRLRRKDGRVIWILYSTGPICGVDGTFRQAVAMLNDITDRKLAEEHGREEEARMREFQRLESLGLMAGGIAHDFNNLLSGVLGNASLLREQLPQTSSAAQTVQAIETSATRAAALCRQLLAYSGRGRFEVTVFDLSKFVQETLALLRMSMDRRHTLELDLIPELAFIKGDASQLQQIILNLVINASEAMNDKPGVVRIATSIADSSSVSLVGTYGVDSISVSRVVIFEVTDKGPGMGEDMLSRIFEPFFSTKGQGRGLGLAAVLGIVRGHGGAMRVTSRIGEGTTFQLILPAYEALVQEMARTRVPQTLSGHGYTVLVIDDEPILRRTARRILEHNGYVVLDAEDGRDGLDLVAKHGAKISVILLDMNMPRMDGFAALRLLHQDYPQIPVVLTSGYSDQDTESLGDAQPSMFVPKPFTRESLLVALATVRDMAGGLGHKR